MAPNVPPQPVPIERPCEFKTEFHPRSGHETCYQPYEEFGVTPKQQAIPAEEEPWRPFRSRSDFEFSEIALDAALNENQVDRLLSLMARISQGQAQIMLANKADLRKALDNAAAELTPFGKHEIKVPYNKEERVFEVHARPIWDWALNLLDNPSLAPHFVWDAQRLYKHNGTDFEHFFNEPWTGDQWWEIQSRLPPDLNAAPFCFILYADKTRLSSHGTVKGYPVMVRCANLPIDIRNGEGIGGGRVVPEDASETGKLGYTTLKRVVWHDSFLKLLVNLDRYSKTGYSYLCYDKITRWLFPAILILSGDYEEQCMMSLIRGLQCKCPCPVCLVPLDELHNLSKEFPIRSAKDAQAALDVYGHNRTQGEEILKGLGLRPVANVLWHIENSDPHEALSLDDLHAIHGGIGGVHLLGELKTILADLGRAAQDNVEKQVAEFPRWRSLAHFTTIIHITFSDGNKKRDLQGFYAALSVLKRQVSPEGYRLLRIICSYLQLDSLVGLDVHTERTLQMIDAKFLVYDAALKDYIEYAATTSSIADIKTDWNFPKSHLWKHMRRDIELKGVARNYSTRPNEKLHGPLKTAYLSRSNGKDVAKQILRVDHHKYAALLLRGRVDTLDEQRRLQALGDELDDEDHDHINLDGHFKLGSPQPNAIQEFENRLGARDPAFQSFRRKFSDFINTLLPTYGYHLTRWTTIPADFQVHEYRYLKINYESTVNWRQSTDHLRCNPSFHGSPHYDCAFIQLTAESTAFVKIILMFKCEVPDVGAFQFAFVQPYTAGIPGGSRRIDRDLRLTRVKAAPRKDSIFVPLKSFIRGAVLVCDPEHQDEFLVVEHIDSNMFLRMKARTH
ncbi:hypothetical protein DEU56DRAFT_870910 [Suillus clintonianus]|uniref:uncharacterized protein n=1 Tax=Suillus clintonianus TaxID=1904413 RepID=UPI001B8657CC|nr:uncharacterized protein DEU56DRAFT_870910 [Suillus clintonianus]KAG2140569.1 hypothetical protein DEU56DRAFT_870910 [Suillus clintonianus]